MTEENRRGNSVGENGSSQRIWTIEGIQRSRKAKSFPVEILYNSLVKVTGHEYSYDCISEEMILIIIIT